MLRVTQKLGAILLAANVTLRVRWIPSELNVSDGPSRGASSPGYYEPAGEFKAKAGKQDWHRLSGNSEAKKTQPKDPVPPREKKNSVGAVKVVRRKVRAERRNVVATFSVGDAPLGKGAQKGQLTQLERKSVSNEQENQYRYYLMKFKDFFAKPTVCGGPPQQRST